MEYGHTWSISQQKGANTNISKVMLCYSNKWQWDAASSILPAPLDLSCQSINTQDFNNNVKNALKKIFRKM